MYGSAPIAKLSGPAARVSHAAVQRQLERLGGGIVVDDSASCHGRQPLAHVPLVQVSGRCDLCASGRRKRRHHIEQTSPMTDTHKQRQCTVIQQSDEPLLKLSEPANSTSVMTQSSTRFP